MSYFPRIGDFVAKKILDTSWIMTGVIVGNYMSSQDIFRVLWSPNPNHPVSPDDFYESFEHFNMQKIFVIRDEKDIPSDFLLPT